jgi:hypothetical protein
MRRRTVQSATARRLFKLAFFNMLRLLRSLLPASAVHVLWAGPDPDGLGVGLGEAGLTVTVEEIPEAPSPRTPPYDALILPSPPETPALTEARAVLAEEGRLLVILPAVPSAAAGPLGVALAEAGFVILREETAEDGRTVVAARKDSFIVRAYREGDEEGILQLFKTSFHVERSRERWRWEYRENPYGDLRITEAFAPDGSLVAHYAGYPVFFSGPFDPTTEGAPRRFAALQIGDTMTAAAFRHVGRGPTSLLGRSVRHFYACYCAGRVAFNYGFNTGNIQRFSMRFVRAERLEDCPYRVLSREAFRGEEPRNFGTMGKIGKLGWRIERVRHFDARFDELFARVRGAYGLLIERDARYLEWRYATCPGSEYFTYALFRFGRLVGWSVFRQKGDRLVWGDALVDPHHRRRLRPLLGHVLALPAHRETRLVEGWLPSRPAWWDETVTALGFERRPEPQELGLVYVPFEHDPGEDFKRYLYYTWGDSDLF